MNLDIRHWRRLIKGDPEESWRFFLETCNPLIMRILTRLDKDYDQRMEAYTYILEKLKEKDFSKINKYFYKPRNYPFERWLAVVVRNCYWDWLRASKGRRRLPKQIENMPQTERTMYQFIFGKGFPIDVTYEIMTSNCGLKISFEEFLQKVEKIKRTVDGEKSVSNFECTVRISSDPEYEDFLIPSVLTDANELPDAKMIDQENRRIFQEVLGKLTPQERLILKLHFSYGRTYRQICTSLKIGEHLRKSTGF